MKCKNCGHALIDGARFCGRCGTLTPVATQTANNSRRIAISDADEKAEDELLHTVELENEHKLTPVAPGTHHKDELLLEPPKPHHLLAGPHPALVKAQQRHHQPESAVTAPPVKHHTEPAAPLVASKQPDEQPAEAPQHDTPHARPVGRADVPGPVSPFSDQMSNRSYLTAFLLSFFLGVFGIDRFYTGQAGLGLLKLATFGGAGIWAYIEAIVILTGHRRDHWGRKLWGRRKDLKLSVWIFVIGSILLPVLIGLAAYFASTMATTWVVDTLPSGALY